MSRFATPLEWLEKRGGIPNSPIIRRKPDVSGVDDILESAAAMAAGTFPTVDDVIPMSELEPTHSMSSSMVEFIGLDNLDRQELDGFDSIPPAPIEPPFQATPSEDAAVREDPFSDRSV